MCKAFTTIEEIEQSGKLLLQAEEIKGILGMDPQSLRNQAQDDPTKLGFPVIVAGSRVKIPAQPFVKFMRGELATASSVTYNYTAGN